MKKVVRMPLLTPYALVDRPPYWHSPSCFQKNYCKLVKSFASAFKDRPVASSWFPMKAILVWGFHVSEAPQRGARVFTICIKLCQSVLEASKVVAGTTNSLTKILSMRNQLLTTGPTLMSYSLSFACIISVPDHNQSSNIYWDQVTLFIRWHCSIMKSKFCWIHLNIRTEFST